MATGPTGLRPCTCSWSCCMWWGLNNGSPTTSYTSHNCAVDRNEEIQNQKSFWIVLGPHLLWSRRRRWGTVPDLFMQATGKSNIRSLDAADADITSALGARIGAPNSCRFAMVETSQRNTPHATHATTGSANKRCRTAKGAAAATEHCASGCRWPRPACKGQRRPACLLPGGRGSSAQCDYQKRIFRFLTGVDRPLGVT